MGAIMKKYFILLFLSFLFVSNSYSQSGWFFQNPIVNTTSLNSIKFVNDSIGWSVGNGGVIIKTTDGGETWSTQNSGTSSDLKSVFFNDQYAGYAVGKNGTVIRTTDGGSNWISQNIGTTSELNSIFFIDQNGETEDWEFNSPRAHFIQIF